MLSGKQGHRAKHWLRVLSLAASAGVWLTAIESVINAAYGPMARKDFTSTFILKKHKKSHFSKYEKP